MGAFATTQPLRVFAYLRSALRCQTRALLRSRHMMHAGTRSRLLAVTLGSRRFLCSVFRRSGSFSALPTAAPAPCFAFVYGVELWQDVKDDGTLLVLERRNTANKDNIDSQVAASAVNSPQVLLLR